MSWDLKIVILMSAKLLNTTLDLWYLDIQVIFLFQEAFEQPYFLQRSLLKKEKKEKSVDYF